MAPQVAKLLVPRPNGSRLLNAGFHGFLFATGEVNTTFTIVELSNPGPYSRACSLNSEVSFRTAGVRESVRYGQEARKIHVTWYFHGSLRTISLEPEGDSVWNPRAEAASSRAVFPHYCRPLQKNGFDSTGIEIR